MHDEEPDDETPTSADSATKLASPNERRRPPARNPFHYEVWKGWDDLEQMKLYLQALRETGILIAAAEVVGCSHREIKAYREREEEFDILVREALEANASLTVDTIRKRAMEGWAVPIVGGKERDQIVTHEIRYSDRLQEMFLKRSDPTFRDKSTVEVQNTGAATFDYSRYSKRVRDQLRKLALMIKEDEDLRERGQDPDIFFSKERRPLHERLKAEQQMVMKNHDRLGAYLYDNETAFVPEERDRIREQLRAMRKHADICGQRAEYALAKKMKADAGEEQSS